MRLARTALVPMIVASMLVVVTIPASAAGRFVDDDGSVHEDNIEVIAARDITRGCNPPANDRFCPTDAVTRAEMATFLVRLLGLPTAGAGPFTDTSGSVHAANIDRLAAAGLTKGCNPPANDEFCPDRPVSRAEVATFLTRALDLPASSGERFDDDETSVHEANIQAIAAAGITRGCNPPSNNRFCPRAPVTRGQMASLLARSFPYLDAPSPTEVVSARDDRYTLAEDTTLTRSAGRGVLRNDTSSFGADLHAQLVSGPTSGVLALRTDGSFAYTPAADATGTVTFRYRARGADDSDLATVRLVIAAVDDPPVPTADEYATLGNTTLRVTSSPSSAPGVEVVGSVLDNDVDVDSSSLTVTDTTAPARGQVVMAADGTFVYEPDTGESGGTDSFDYTVSDGSTAAVGTVTIVLGDPVWYVDGDASVTGDGTLSTPFGDSADVEDASAPGDTVFVFSATAADDRGIALQAGQRLVGEASGLSFGARQVVAPGDPGTLAGPIEVASDNTITGVAVEASGSALVSTGDVGSLVVGDSSLATTGSDPAVALDGDGTLDLDADSAVTGGVSLANLGGATIAGEVVADGTCIELLDLSGTVSMTGLIDTINCTDGAFVVAGGSSTIELAPSSTSAILNAPGDAAAIVVDGFTGSLGVDETVLTFPMTGPDLRVTSSAATIRMDASPASGTLEVECSASGATDVTAFGTRVGC